MINLNALIIEDNLTAISMLKSLVKGMGCYILATIDNSDEALAFIYNTPPDLIFMNIDIKGTYGGPELVRKIMSLHIPIIHIPAVFYTKEEEYENDSPNAIRNTLAQANGKLILYTSVALAIHSFRNGSGYQYTDPESSQSWSDCKLNDCIFIKKGQSLCKVCFKDILYIKADGNYCELQTADEKFIHKITLIKLVNSLPRRHFLKIHRSYVVYIHHIRKFSLSRNELTVGRFTVPIGKGYKTTLLNSLRKI